LVTSLTGSTFHYDFNAATLQHSIRIELPYNRDLPMPVFGGPVHPVSPPQNFHYHNTGQNVYMSDPQWNSTFFDPNRYRVGIPQPLVYVASPVQPGFGNMPTRLAVAGPMDSVSPPALAPHFPVLAPRSSLTPLAATIPGGTLPPRSV
jgi:hypothetical protein